ncbi:NusG domain II-containing protein [Natroniella sulfidigena]|uniref:NusG domain II-containing protein n=1 Tax=Natroniella sulfidigena TaxID=723921 RepID=UPI00200A5A79|nr:NusG domain II-containing protein [Natroniella sulfidigena]MCK8817980.1 NusG domain II-containing protein [Natroniella sulfidigena]
MIKKLGLDKINKIMTVADKVVVVLVILISLSMLVLTPKVITKEVDGSKDVVVTMDNEEVYRHELLETEELERVEFDFSFEGEKYQGVLLMQDGEVRLDRLSSEISPLPIHHEMGWISESYEMIVSMPIKMVVTVETVQETETEEDIDAMTF